MKKVNCFPLIQEKETKKKLLNRIRLVSKLELLWEWMQQEAIGKKQLLKIRRCCERASWDGKHR